MSLTELSYEELKQEFINDLKQQHSGALATSDGKNVTNRFIALFSDELTLYCFTGEDSRKFKQLSVNPKVSIATGSLQIDGTATITGHPLDEDNARFIELFKEQQPEAFQVHEKLTFSMQSTRVIKITPTRIGKYKPTKIGEWEYNGFLDFLNISTRKAHRLDLFGEYQVPEYYE
jgi:general stress protein 26